MPRTWDESTPAHTNSGLTKLYTDHAPSRARQSLGSAFESNAKRSLCPCPTLPSAFENEAAVVTWWSSLAWVKKVEEAGTTGILLHAFLRWLARSRCVSSAAQIARSYLHTDERRSTSLFYLIRKRSYVHSPKTEGNHPQCTYLLPMSTKSYVRPVQHNNRGTHNANTHT